MPGRRVSYLVLGLVMAIFAGLQTNDPDPWLWVSLYSVTAGLFVLALLGWSRRWAVMVVWAAHAANALFLLPGFFEWLLHHPLGDLVGVMSPERQYVEDSRELLGLLIAALGLLVLWFWPPPIPVPDLER